MHINVIKKYYFINKFDTNNIDKQDKQTTIIYRNYSSKPSNPTLILKIKKYCKKKSIKFYLSNDIKLAIKLDLDGAYIPAFNKSLKHLAYSYKKNFQIIGSAHNLKEIRIKENQNVKKIFLSSLFKKNKNFLGINRFKLLSRLTKKNVVMLGGISNKSKKKIPILNQSDFAGISYFEQKKGPKKGPFF
jgi:thiamine-phosphate pyrophosphorylase